ncbi:hypothetical protein ICE98_02477 [Lactococcus lactis]|nr:hypothetical protein [Lactococcus lactis]
MKERLQAPELRFPGFTDDWEERKLTDVTYSYSGLTYSPTDVQDKGTFVLRSSNVKNDQLIDADNVYVNPDVVNSNNVKVGDVIVVVRNGSRSLIGKHAIVTKEMPHTVIGAFMSAFRGENGDYINALLSTNNFQKEVHKSLGATINQITGKDFSMMNFLTPKLEEQNKIGSFFKQLDNTIALHQRKLDLLKEQKKGYLQKMFPKNGAKVPELRFAGFADDWEERKFFESIASTIDFRGRTPKKLGMDWSDSGYLALSALNVKNGYIDPLADAHYGDEKLYRKWMSGRELKKGQVLFTTEAPMGNVAQVPDDNGYILSQRTVAFETKEDMMTNDFLAVLLKSPLVFNNLSALSSGGTAKGVSQKSLKGLSITVPLDIDEQQKIGSFFKQLDDTIALHQRKLDLLKEQKKGFLQKMFV